LDSDLGSIFRKSFCHPSFCLNLNVRPEFGAGEDIKGVLDDFSRQADTDDAAAGDEAEGTDHEEEPGRVSSR
jgi:hypothetical protein